MSDPATEPAEVAARHARIVELARAGGSVSVEALATTLSVTPQTIRKDLMLLERRSPVTRVHGGATASSGTADLAYAERRGMAVTAKAAIGRAAAALVPDESSLFINIGTTAEAIARALVGRRRLMAVTNNLNVVDILADQPGTDVTAAGGRVRPSDRAVIGTVAVDFIRGFKVDVALIGASAVEPDGSLLGFDVDEVRASHIIVRNAGKVVLAVDASKFNRAAPVRVGTINDIDTVVTDEAMPNLKAMYAAAGVRLIEARSYAVVEHGAADPRAERVGR